MLKISRSACVPLNVSVEYSSTKIIQKQSLLNEVSDKRNTETMYKHSPLIVICRLPILSLSRHITVIYSVYNHPTVNAMLLTELLISLTFRFIDSNFNSMSALVNVFDGKRVFQL